MAKSKIDIEIEKLEKKVKSLKTRRQQDRTADWLEKENDKKQRWEVLGVTFFNARVHGGYGDETTTVFAEQFRDIITALRYFNKKLAKWTSEYGQPDYVGEEHAPGSQQADWQIDSDEITSATIVMRPL